MVQADNYGETLNNRIKDIESLYEIYPVLKKLIKIIRTQVVFGTVYADEYVAGADETCTSVLFVIKGTIKLLISKNSKIIYATHNELAFEVDSAREVVSRNLKRIEKRGYIELERGKILILKDLKEILKI